MDDFIQTLSDAHPGYASFILHITTLASAYLPPFIYINDPNNPRITTAVIDAIFRDVSSIPDAPPTLYAHVNAVACFTPRVFYDTVLNALAGWKPSWENGCQVWPGDDSQRYNDSIDSFLHGLRRLRLDRTAELSRGKGKGKTNASANDQGPSMVILIDRAEKLFETLPELVVPLSRLAELSRTNLSLILLSSVSWEDIRPALGASPDPYFMDMEPLAKRDVLQRLVSAFRRTSLSRSPSDTLTYHPSLQPLYEQYVDTLYDALSIYTKEPLELQYVAAARWPGFVNPVITQYHELVQQAEEEGSDHPELEPPNTAGRLRLFKFFLPTFTAALDALYPRLDNAADWATNNDYDAGQTSSNRDNHSNGGKPVSSHRVDRLPRMSKYILIAAYLASTNPPKSDLRMFGRGAEERKKRSRKSLSPKKGGGAQTVVKVSQRLLGPATFPLDRMLAILGMLLEENDYETRPHDPRFELPGEYTDMEIGRVHVYGAIAELTLTRALHRTTPPDKLEIPIFKCGISHDVASALARDLDVPLNDLMWDPA